MFILRGNHVLDKLSGIVSGEDGVYYSWMVEMLCLLLLLVTVSICIAYSLLEQP